MSAIICSRAFRAERIEPQMWDPLGLPHNPAYWQSLHAVKCFTVTSDFLNFCFSSYVVFPSEAGTIEGLSPNFSKRRSQER